MFLRRVYKNHNNLLKHMSQYSTSKNLPPWQLRPFQIAIDGPAASGKSTTSRKIAEFFGYVYLETGALYRSVTYKALQLNLWNESSSPEKLKELLIEVAKNSTISLERNPETDEIQVLLDGTDITQDIRSPLVSQKVSEVASIQPIREHLLSYQKHLAFNSPSINPKDQKTHNEHGQIGIILEGRDIGSVILPQADIKFFIKADVESRAFRRYQQLLASKPLNSQKVNLEDIKKEIEARDFADTNREVSPLTQAKDAIVIDTTNLTIEEQVQKIIRLVQKRLIEY